MHGSFDTEQTGKHRHPVIELDAVSGKLHTVCVVVFGRCRREAGEIPGASNVRKKKNNIIGPPYVTGGRADLVTWLVMLWLWSRAEENIVQTCFATLGAGSDRF